jgi:hypothetical protein
MIQPRHASITAQYWVSSRWSCNSVPTEANTKPISMRISALRVGEAAPNRR